MATVRPFVVDAALTAISVRYSNPAANLIADQVLPRVDVPGEKYKWNVYNLADAFTLPDTKVGRKSRPNQVEFGGTEQTSSVKDYALDDPIPQTDIDAAQALRAQGISSYDPEAAAVMGLTDLIALDREVRVANIVFNAATYDASRTQVLSGTSQFSDYTNSDPIGIINAALDATLVYRPNCMTIGRPGWTKLRSHPKIVNAVKGNVTGSGNVTTQQVAELFDLQNVWVGEAFLNTARKGQNAQLSRVWGKHLSLFYQDRNATNDRGITFGFSGVFGTRVSGRIADPNIGINGGEYIRVGERIDENIVAPSVGFLLQNIAA